MSDKPSSCSPLGTASTRPVEAPDRSIGLEGILKTPYRASDTNSATPIKHSVVKTALAVPWAPPHALNVVNRTMCSAEPKKIIEVKRRV